MTPKFRAVQPLLWICRRTVSFGLGINLGNPSLSFNFIAVTQFHPQPQTMNCSDAASKVLQHLLKYRNSNSFDLAEAIHEPINQVNNAIDFLCFTIPDWIIKEETSDGSKYNIFLLEQGDSAVKKLLSNDKTAIQ